MVCVFVISIAIAATLAHNEVQRGCSTTIRNEVQCSEKIRGLGLDLYTYESEGDATERTALLYAEAELMEKKKPFMTKPYSSIIIGSVVDEV